MTTITPQINFETRRAYQGEKAETLHNAAIAKGYTSNEWGTMKMWNRNGRSVASGEQGTPITLYRILESDQGPVKEEYTERLYNRGQLRKAQ